MQGLPLDHILIKTHSTEEDFIYIKMELLFCQLVQLNLLCFCSYPIQRSYSEIYLFCFFTDATLLNSWLKDICSTPSY